MRRRFYYDFHVHSCLSPCADNDMTPGNIAGTASLAGLEIVALTDHNSCRNCACFVQTADRFGITAVSGMELTTAEDIHVVCLFEHQDDAVLFDSIIDGKRCKFQNRPDIFGEQLVMDINDRVIGSDPYLLPNATNLTIEEAVGLCLKMGGVCWPAHIDREANGILAVLGCFPETPYFRFAEFRNMTLEDKLRHLHPQLQKVHALFGSDAHRLEDIPDACYSLELEVGNGSPDEVRTALFRFLRHPESR
jgi:3',5'-nucleoside bisphosphate phosphatase